MSKLSRVIFLSNHLRGPKGSAGARSWHQTLALSKKFMVSVIIPGIDPVTAKPVTAESYEGLPFDRVFVSKIYVPENNRSRIITRAAYYLRMIPRQLIMALNIKQPSAVLSMSLPITTLAVAFLVSLVKRVPLIVDVRDMPFDMAEEIGYLKKGVFLSILKASERFLLRRAAAVVTNSPRYQNELIAKGIPVERIHLALIGFDGFDSPSVAQVQQSRTEMLSKLDGKTDFISLFSGTLGYALSVDVIIKLARLMQDDRSFGFVLVGDGQRYEELRETCKNENLNVVFTGRITKQKVASICKAANCLLYPGGSGRYSGSLLGNKVFDYIGAERPILYMGGDSAVWDLISNANAGLRTPSNDVNGMRDILMFFRTNPSACRELSPGISYLRSEKLTATDSANIVRDVVYRNIHTQ